MKALDTLADFGTQNVEPKVNMMSNTQSNFNKTKNFEQRRYSETSNSFPSDLSSLEDETEKDQEVIRIAMQQKMNKTSNKFH